MKKEDAHMMVIADCGIHKGEALLEKTDQILSRGANLLLFQAEAIEGDAEDDARQVLRLCQSHSRPFLLAKDVQKALEIQADGVHLDNPAMILPAREKLGPDSLIGLTVSSLDEALDAELRGADYCALRIPFRDEKTLREKETWRSFINIVRAVKIPVLAQGALEDGSPSLLAGSGVSGLIVETGLYETGHSDVTARWLLHKLRLLLHGGSRVEGVLMDCDGTLTDTRALVRNLGLDYLRENGYQPGADLPEIIADKSLSEAAAYIKHNYSVREGVCDVLNDWHDKLAEGYEKAEAKPGAQRFLQELAGRQIPVVALCAHKAQLMESLLAQCDLLDHVTAQFSGWESRYSGSESAYYEEAGSLLPQSGREKWVFEDRLSALQAADSAGFRTAAVYDSLQSEDEWQALVRSADVAFLSYEAAINWLKGE